MNPYRFRASWKGPRRVKLRENDPYSAKGWTTCYASVRLCLDAFTWSLRSLGEYDLAHSITDLPDDEAYRRIQTWAQANGFKVSITDLEADA